MQPVDDRAIGTRDSAIIVDIRGYRTEGRKRCHGDWLLCHDTAYLLPCGSAFLERLMVRRDQRMAYGCIWNYVQRPFLRSLLCYGAIKIILLLLLLIVVYDLTIYKLFSQQEPFRNAPSLSIPERKVKFEVRERWSKTTRKDFEAFLKVLSSRDDYSVERRLCKGSGHLLNWHWTFKYWEPLLLLISLGLTLTFIYVILQTTFWCAVTINCSGSKKARDTRDTMDWRHGKMV